MINWLHVLGFCVERFSIFLDSKVFSLHYVSMWNMDSLKILDSWSLKFCLCWFVEFIIYELWTVLKGFLCLWGCVVYCLIVFLFMFLCLSRLLCVCLFKYVCLWHFGFVCVLLILVFKSLYAMFVKVCCLFFFQGLLVVCLFGSAICWLLVCLFLFKSICIVYVYCLLVYLYLSLKVCCLSIYLFMSFRVTSCIYFWKLICFFFLGIEWRC
jgi:hypothetical protein